MRSFKFRVWSLVHKCWLNHCAIIDCQGKVGSHFVEVLTENGVNKVVQHMIGLDPETIVIQQWTGLFDGNKKELFEGDIVKYAGSYFDGGSPQDFEEESAYNPICVVTWGKNYYADRLGFDLLDTRGKELPNNFYGGFNAVGTEITGNIFENPELLT